MQHAHQDAFELGLIQTGFTRGQHQIFWQLIKCIWIIIIYSKVILLHVVVTWFEIIYVILSGHVVLNTMCYYNSVSHRSATKAVKMLESIYWIAKSCAVQLSSDQWLTSSTPNRGLISYRNNKLLFTNIFVQRWSGQSHKMSTLLSLLVSLSSWLSSLMPEHMTGEWPACQYNILY